MARRRLSSFCSLYSTSGGALGSASRRRNTRSSSAPAFTASERVLGAANSVDARGQGLTLPHFSAGRKRFLWVGGCM